MRKVSKIRNDSSMDLVLRAIEEYPEATNQAIADALGLSETTVRRHRHNAYLKNDDVSCGNRCPRCEFFPWLANPFVGPYCFWCMCECLGIDLRALFSSGWMKRHVLDEETVRDVRHGIG